MYPRLFTWTETMQILGYTSNYEAALRFIKHNHTIAYQNRSFSIQRSNCGFMANWVLLLSPVSVIPKNEPH